MGWEGRSTQQCRIYLGGVVQAGYVPKELTSTDRGLALRKMSVLVGVSDVVVPGIPSIAMHTSCGRPPALSHLLIA